MDPIQLDRIAAAAAQAFPDIGTIPPLRVLGSGFRSVAVETAGGFVLKVGLIPDAAQDYAKEWRIGRFLAEELPGIVPEPQWYAPPGERFAHGAIAYPKRPGETPAWGSDAGPAFARDVGAFMARLHAIPIDAAGKAGVPYVDAYARMLGARLIVMPVLAERLDGPEYARVVAWWNRFATDAAMRTSRRALCHHDLWHDNLLRSADGRLSGVLDIAHVEISDPAHDFAAPRYFGDAFVTELLVAYRAAGGRFDETDAYRAQRFFEARDFGGLAWAVEHDDGAEIADAIAKLRRGPILSE
jgi:aminoglycoside phosphotransferase (APT) family kinase protein